MPRKKIIWNSDSTHLPPQQLKLIRSSINPISPWQSTISCVDGRELEQDGDYVQMLGGSLQMALWVLFCSWRSGEELTFAEAFEKSNQLHEISHLRLGIHNGPHANYKKGVTDCGFADNLLTIVETLAGHGHEIRALLNHGAHANSTESLINHRNEEYWDDIIDLAGKIVKRAKSDKKYAFLKSPEMFKSEEKLAGSLVTTHLAGEHQEHFAHVNLASGTSTNTHRLNELEMAGFNLDLWYCLEVVARAPGFRDLGCSSDFLQLLTLGLYQATERVLRADKAPLPIVITDESDL